MQYDIGQPVKWIAQVGGQAVTKYGHVYARVPANMNPRDLVPKNMFFSSKSEFRPKDSWFLRVPRVAICYWPLEFWPVTSREEEVKIYTQDVPKALEYQGYISDTSDREKLKFIFELAGERYVERKPFVTNIDTQTRYWFWGEDGVEYIRHVERFQLSLA